ncbi:MAG: pantoate--beta-alanine ligase [Bacteroidales bacterium]|nr:pantoate--beta-alanine ligase [Bacteroidales bacterium]HPD95307.1 pantoate--beta-alanine ligase [Tenuifilaceae bacterium]HRX31585.1 pantoate--beta-alanine ligase [Tenuifilaceae bacterium]
MKVLTTVNEVKNIVNKLKKEGKQIGFVPTMGALHQGHISLVEKAVKENDVAIVSVFVNPTQFNDKNDLKNYPRTPEKDTNLLDNAGVKFVFMPSETEMYPEPDTRIFDFGMLDKVMEGKFRPGHFNGVAQVVSKFFQIVQPDRAYFGQKDFQQLTIIRKMVKLLNLNVEIVGCPIVRGTDGLALSSRNKLLSEAHREAAPSIYKTLSESRNLTVTFNVKDLTDWVISTINKNPLLKVEYYEIVNAETLEPINNWNDAKHVVGCITVWAGNVRLIDNIIYK